MDIKSLPEEVQHIWKVAKVVQGVMGFTMGLYVFTYGPLFYEKLVSASNPEMGMILSSLWFGTQYALLAFLEVPTGAIGDAIGRKWTVVMSFVFRACFFACFAFIPFANTVSLILTFGILANIAFGFGYTFFSGTFTAWCVDSLRERAPNIGYEHLLSRAYTYNFIAQIFGGVLGVVFYLWHIPWVGFLLAAVVCAVCVAFCLGEMEDEQSLQYLERKSVSLATITKRVGEVVGLGFQVFRQSSVILSLVLVFASYMFVVNIVDYLWPVYVRSRVPNELQSFSWIGLVVATLLISSLGSHALTLWTRKWHKHHGVRTHNVVLRKWLIAACLLSGIPILILSWLTWHVMDTFWFFTATVLSVEFSYGVIAPCYETLMNNYIPDTHAKERATILSFGSLVRGLFVMLLAIPAGGSSGEQTTIGWAIPAFFLLVSAIVGHFVLKRAQKRAPDIVVSSPTILAATTNATEVNE